MKTLTEIDKLHIQNVKKRLEEKFENVVNSIFCFGSRVSENRIDTDFDIIVITESKISWQLENSISSEIIDYGIDNDILFDTKYFSVEEFNNVCKYSPFIDNIKSYGVAV